MQDLKIDCRGNEKQKKALGILFNQASPLKEIGYGGGAGGAKSYTGVIWIWLMCIKYSGISAFFGRKELKNLKRTTLATYFKMLGDYNIPEKYRGNYNAQDGIIRFSNGSLIHLLDLSHQPSDPLYLRFGSLELTIGFIDESNEINYSCIDILKTRVGRQRNKEFGIVPRLLETFNPDKGHVYRRFYKPFTNGTLKENITFISSLATDNKYLDESYIESLRNSDPITRERLLFGNFEYDDTPGRIFEYEAIKDLFKNKVETGTKYITGDIARKGKDKAVIYIWEGLQIIEKKVFGICSLTDIENYIKQKATQYSIGYRNIIVDEDGVGGGVVDHLRCKGFVNNSRQLESKANKLNYQNLKTQCYFKLAELVNNDKIGIDNIFSGEEIDNLTEELDIIVEKDLDKDGKKKIINKDEIKEKIGRSPDYSDAMMFRMFFEIQPNKVATLYAIK